MHGETLKFALVGVYYLMGKFYSLCTFKPHIFAQHTWRHEIPYQTVAGISLVLSACS